MEPGAQITILDSARFDFTNLGSAVGAVVELAAAIPTGRWPRGSLVVRIEEKTTTGGSIQVKATPTWPSARSTALYVRLGANGHAIVADVTNALLLAGNVVVGRSPLEIDLGPALRVTLEPTQGTGGATFTFTISVMLLLYA